MRRITALDTSYDALKELWKAEEGLTGEEKHKFTHVVLSSLSLGAPIDAWKLALELAKDEIARDRARR